VRRDLEGAGVSIGMADSLIAGIVLEHGGRLLTRNQRHFERVEGLPLVQHERSQRDAIALAIRSSPSSSADSTAYRSALVGIRRGALASPGS